MKKDRPVDPGGVPPPPPPPPGDKYIIDRYEFWFTLVALIFMLVNVFYNMSRDGLFGLSTANWNTVWAISENGMLIAFAILLERRYVGIIRRIFTWIFIPLFVVKLIYHISCFAGLYILPPHTWEIIWSFACGAAILTGVILLIKKYTQ